LNCSRVSGETVWAMLRAYLYWSRLAVITVTPTVSDPDPHGTKR
jgi:hypothetical protein